MTAQPFPERPWWSAHVVDPADDPKFGNPTFWAYYRTKYELGVFAAPTAIAEIGVRYGYSAWSFLCAAPAASYTGFDRQLGTHGGVKGVDTFAAVAALLARDFPAAAVHLVRADTQTLESLGGPYDLIHVDGDHSEAGCYADLERALAACRAGGVILIDDYDYIAGVRRAVDRFACDYADRIAGQRYVATLRGDIVLTVREGRA